MIFCAVCLCFIILFYRQIWRGELAGTVDFNNFSVIIIATLCQLLQSFPLLLAYFSVFCLLVRTNTNSLKANLLRQCALIGRSVLRKDNNNNWEVNNIGNTFLASKIWPKDQRLLIPIEMHVFLFWCKIGMSWIYRLLYLISVHFQFFIN